MNYENVLCVSSRQVRDSASPHFNQLPTCIIQGIAKERKAAGAHLVTSTPRNLDVHCAQRKEFYDERGYDSAAGCCGKSLMSLSLKPRLRTKSRRGASDSSETLCARVMMYIQERLGAATTIHE